MCGFHHKLCLTALSWLDYPWISHSHLPLVLAWMFWPASSLWIAAPLSTAKHHTSVIPKELWHFPVHPSLFPADRGRIGLSKTSFLRQLVPAGRKSVPRSTNTTPPIPAGWAWSPCSTRWELQGDEILPGSAAWQTVPLHLSPFWQRAATSSCWSDPRGQLHCWIRSSIMSHSAVGKYCKPCVWGLKATFRSAERSLTGAIHWIYW